MIAPGEDGKIELLIEPLTGWHPRHCGPRPLPVKRALPYSRSRQGAYVHRLRSGLLHVYCPTAFDDEKGGWYRVSNEVQHVGAHFKLWCGQHATTARMRSSWEFFGEPPEGADVCATCEGRAVGAGYESTVLIANHPVKFSPRRSTAA